MIFKSNSPKIGRKRFRCSATPLRTDPDQAPTTSPCATRKVKAAPSAIGMKSARWYAIAARRGVLSAHASLGYALLTLGNRLSAKEAFETGTQHGSRECAEGLRLIREAEKHAANSRKHLGNGGSNNDAMRHSKSDPENERGSAILDIVKQLEKELENTTNSVDDYTMPRVYTRNL